MFASPGECIHNVSLGWRYCPAEMRPGRLAGSRNVTLTILEMI
jgi:hypothetical protein